MKKPKKAAAAVETSTAIRAIKGFDKDLKCRGFQFATGETYAHEGDVKACRAGFHAISGHPLEVFSYYPPAGSRFAIVELSGRTDTELGGDSKVAAEIIKIGNEIGLADLAEEAVKWVFDRAKWSEGPVATGDNEGATASGDQGAATASGYQGAATASGDQGAATASGTRGAATASGDQGAATASGTRGAATASGYQGAATASGYQGAATASGTQGAATASGYQGAATASGDQGAATASGYQGAATASGTRGAATASGFNGKARGAVGSALFLVRRHECWGEKNHGEITHVWAGVVGRDGIEPDTFYTLDEVGHPVKAEA
jgi:hypothetical protein